MAKIRVLLKEIGMEIEGEPEDIAKYLKESNELIMADIKSMVKKGNPLAV